MLPLLATPRRSRAPAVALCALGAVLAAACGPSGERPRDGGQAPARAAADKPAASPAKRPFELFADWDPEAFSASITPTLARLQEVLEHGDTRGPASFLHLVRDGFHCDPLRPQAFEPPVELSAVRLRRAAPPVEEEHGITGMLRGLSELHDVLASAEHPHVKFKVIGLEPLADDRATSTLWLQSVGSGAHQVEAHWRLTWSEAASDDPWLEAIEVLRHDELERLTPEQPLFADVTEAVLGANAGFARLLRPGLNHWLTQLDSTLGNRLFGHNGLAVADVNGDGLDDLYVCLNGGLPNQLFLARPDGTAGEASAASGLDFLDDTRSALFADLDGDGDQDVAIGSRDLVFLTNDGAGVFREAARFAGDDQVHSLAAADFDLDGDLDLYACRYETGDRRVPDPYFDAHNGPPNALYSNETRADETQAGALRLRDVTAQTGLDQGNDRFSLAAAWADVDDDGDFDLYVANDYGRNNLYRNEDAHFRDVAAEAGVEDVAASRSVAWGDVDDDGRPDLYVGNMFSSAGNRLISILQDGDAALSARDLLERHARGNALFRNLGDGRFADESMERDVTLGRWAWSSVFAEVDNDGREDLLIANGFVTNAAEEDL